MQKSPLQITLKSSVLDAAEVHVASLKGRETIGQNFSFNVGLLAGKEEPLSIAELRGSPIGIVFSRNDSAMRTIWGMVAEVEEYFDFNKDYRRYELSVVPRAHRLSLVRTQDIFLDTSWPDAIAEKLKRVGLALDSEMRLQADYAKREYSVQYDETDLAFVSRLAEHAGISFYFQHDDDGERIVFTDHNGGFASADEPIPYRSWGGNDDIYSLRGRSICTPKSVVMQEYNYRTPLVDLTASETVSDGFGGGIAEFGAHYKTPAEGQQFAKVRAEEVHAHQHVYEGVSGRPDLFAGLHIEVSEQPELPHKNLLITEVSHEARQATMHQTNSEEPGFYRNTFIATLSERTYRPRRITPRPKLSGFFTGVVQPDDMHVVGPSAQLDEAGRYRVRLMFDVKPREGWVSRPIRMAQPFSGAGHGMHFPLRPGVEVAVIFANGDPDRPIIVGALDNPQTPSPTVNKNARQNVISTASGIKIVMRDSR